LARGAVAAAAARTHADQESFLTAALDRDVALPPELLVCSTACVGESARPWSALGGDGSAGVSAGAGASTVGAELLYATIIANMAAVSSAIENRDT
jgi:hypothetical protein